MSQSTRPSLFPISSTCAASFAEEKHHVRNEQGKTLEWLENASYTAAASATAAQLQEELKEEDDISKELSSSDVCQSDEEYLPKVKERDSTLETSEKYGIHKKPKKKKHHKKKQKKEKRAPTEERDEKITIFAASKTFIDDIPGLMPEHAFRVDRKADKNLWNYDSVSKLHLAKYKDVTDQVLGCEMNVKVSKLTANGHPKPNKEKSHYHDFRYFGRERRKEIRAPGRFVAENKTSEKNSSFESSAFIAIRSDADSSKKTAENPLGIMDWSTEQYIQGKGLEKRPDIDLESTDFDETIQKVADFNRKLREQPTNIPLWLDFLHFQENISKDGVEVHKAAVPMGKTALRSKALLEKQMAILERALGVNPGNIELKLAQLALWEEMWESTRVDQEWEQILLEHPGDGQLWRRYLLYQQARLSTFSVSHVSALYSRAFHTLLALLEGNKVDKIPPGLPEEMISLFVQFCDFLKQSGHTEKAVACYQALLEFNLFCSADLHGLPVADKLVAFECFWDSSVARIGEEGAQGWCHWAASKKASQSESSSQETDTSESEDEVINKKLPQWQTWLKIESLREAAHVLPWRPDHGQTVEDCEDLDRLVLFEDISAVLFPLPDKNAIFCVLMNFIKLLGLNTDHTLSLCGNQWNDWYPIVQIHELPQLAELDCGLSMGPSFAPHIRQVHIIHTLLKQTLPLFSGLHLAQISLTLLQLQCCQLQGRVVTKAERRDVQKFAKNLLKEEPNRNNLLVWHAYAELEAGIGKKNDAVGIVETALSMFSGTDPLSLSGSAADSCSQGLGLLALYQTHAELLLNFHLKRGISFSSAENPSENAILRAAKSLATLAANEKFLPKQIAELSATEQLRSQHMFKQMISKILDEVCDKPDDVLRGELVHRITSCAALFQLCCAGVHEAVNVYADVQRKLKQIGNSQFTKSLINVFQEKLYQAEVHFVVNVMKTSSLPLVVLRTVLDQALKDFPTSPSLLQCLVAVEARSHISGRQHRYFWQALKSGKSSVPAVFAIVASMVQHHSRRQALEIADSGNLINLPETGMTHRTRALFEKGLQHLICQQCPLLWRLYIHFEMQFGKKERAKGIFYRSLQHCPWAKEIYKDGVNLFREEEFQDILNLMAEKEIRVQVPVEEVALLLEGVPVTETNLTPAELNFSMEMEMS